MKITFEIGHNISHSKGWGRYKANTPAGKLVVSTTGNEWVYAGHSGEAEEGTPITATLQTMRRSGKGRTSKENVNTTPYSLVAAQGQRAELGHWDGLQVIVENAHLVG